MVNQDQVWIIFEKYSWGETNKVTEIESEALAPMQARNLYMLTL